MKYIIIIVLVVASLDVLGQQWSIHESDINWMIGEDLDRPFVDGDWQHFQVLYVTTLGTYAFIDNWDETRNLNYLQKTGLTIGVNVGIGFVKEGFDFVTKNNFSYMDFRIDLAGVATATVVYNLGRPLVQLGWRIAGPAFTIKHRPDGAKIIRDRNRRRLQKQAHDKS